MQSPEKHPGSADILGQPPRTGRFWFDLLAAMFAIFISVLSLVVAMRGEETQRWLLASNAWPFIQLAENRGLEAQQLDVENEGVGPAKIKTFELFYKGQPVDNAVELLKICCGVQQPTPGKSTEQATHFMYGAVYGNVLRPGEHIVALELKKALSSPELYDRFSREMPSFSFRTCYCSVLDECWTSNLRDLTQTQVISCPAEPHPFLDGRMH